MALFTYVVRYDIGFAPNPFFGYCTLATCKPGIRRSGLEGDWVAGIGSKQKGQEGRLVFAMQVEERLSFDEYWQDPRFARKRPNRIGSIRQRYGDNVYHRDNPQSEWRQEDCRHSRDDGGPNWSHVRRDTNPPVVLVSQRFAYYGASAIEIPDKFRSWNGNDVCRGGRGYRRNFPEDLRDAFVDWLKTRTEHGLAGEPLDWPV